MLKKITRIYLRVVECICLALLVMILVCMCIQIGCRLVNVGQSFTEELAKLCFSTMIFVGAPLVAAEGVDIMVDMLVNKLPAGLRRVIETVANALSVVFAAVAIRGFTVFIGANNGVTAVSMTWLQMNWLYYSYLVSFALLGVVGAVKAVCAITGKSQTIDINEAEKKEAAEHEKELNLGI